MYYPGPGGGGGGGGGGVRGCATGQIMSFVLFGLNRVYNFAQVCPKQCPHPLS